MAIITAITKSHDIKTKLCLQKGLTVISSSPKQTQWIKCLCLWSVNTLIKQASQMSNICSMILCTTILLIINLWGFIFLAYTDQFKTAHIGSIFRSIILPMIPALGGMGKMQPETTWLSVLPSAMHSMTHFSTERGALFLHTESSVGLQ